MMSEAEKIADIENEVGINEMIPMTPRPVPGLSNKQLWKDGKIARELIYLWDVKHNGPAMVGFFVENRHRLSDQRYWELLKSVWIAAGRKENYVLFRRLFSSKRPFRFFVMSPEEEALLASLPQTFTVYRATSGDGDEGLSWTLNRDWLTEYAQKTGRVITERVVNRQDVFAFFNRRGEDEILIL